MIIITIDLLKLVQNSKEVIPSPPLKGGKGKIEQVYYKGLDEYNEISIPTKRVLTSLWDLTLNLGIEVTNLPLFGSSTSIYLRLELDTNPRYRKSFLPASSLHREDIPLLGCRSKSYHFKANEESVTYQKLIFKDRNTLTLKGLNEGGTEGIEIEPPSLLKIGNWVDEALSVWAKKAAGIIKIIILHIDAKYLAWVPYNYVLLQKLKLDPWARNHIKIYNIQKYLNYGSHQAQAVYYNLHALSQLSEVMVLSSTMSELFMAPSNFKKLKKS